ncbi:MAG: hypothetical protein Q7U23_11890 [Methylococcales bacterium]|nr:hypothetical protein [Methylococcales bacterium]
MVSDDAWLDELIYWAVENNIPEYFDDEDEPWHGFPRDKQDILALTELYLCEHELTELPESIGKLTNLKLLYLSDNPIKSLSAQHSHLSNIIQSNYDLFDNILFDNNIFFDDEISF